jgi:hypothetical protein
MIAFNMQNPIANSAFRDIVENFFILTVMIFSGLALSSVVTDLAVRPLERMLTTVRHIASTVFKFSEDSLGEQADPTEIEGTGEMILLEKVVDRLTTIAALHRKHNTGTHREQMDKEGMQQEDLGVITMMDGNKWHDDKQGKVERVSSRTKAIRHTNLWKPRIQLESQGISPELYNSWSFNTLDLRAEQRVHMAVYTVTRFHETGKGECFIKTPEEEDILQRFVASAQQEYSLNPFHNFGHAVDVLYAVSRILRLIGCDKFLSELQQFALLVAAIGHDIGHLGMNNGFLLEVQHELALQYNDRSPLENMHCAKLYAILAKPENNVFKVLSKEQYKEVRKVCIDTILHTDMINHQAMVKELQMTYEMNSEVFVPRPWGSSTRTSIVMTRTKGVRSNPSPRSPSSPDSPADVFNQVEVRQLIMNAVLHSGDVSNPCRSWEVSQAWAYRCLEEFFAQGDEEKRMGIPVQFLNDRDRLNRPNSQIGFIEFMIAPFFAAQLSLWPKLNELGENLSENIAHWEELWIEQTSPAEEERQKVAARIEKVREALDKAACPI